MKIQALFAGEEGSWASEAMVYTPADAEAFV